jgi:ribosome-associated translation inhibitor RaiA
MKRTIDIKHVGPDGQVRNLIDHLIDRLADKLRHFPEDSVSVHVLFEENGSHKVYRTSLTCHLPRHMAAAHEESRDAGATIRRAFAEVERQLERQDAMIRRKHLRRRAAAEPSE